MRFLCQSRLELTRLAFSREVLDAVSSDVLLNDPFVKTGFRCAHVS